MCNLASTWSSAPRTPSRGHTLDLVRCPWCLDLAGGGARCAVCRRQLRPERATTQGVSSGIVGMTIDRYRVVALLGTGRTHEVYSVDDRGTGFSFALKLPMAQWGQATIDAAARDYTILRQLDDPHLVRIR
jgi:hypothetical protein